MKLKRILLTEDNPNDVKLALHAFKAHPIDGTGAGTFAFWWWSHDGDEFLRDAHSLYLEELGEQGIVGGVLILTFVGGLAVVGLRGCHRTGDRGHLAGGNCARAHDE